MKNRALWSYIEFICVVCLILGCVTALQAKVKTQTSQSQLANSNLPGLEVRTIEEALALPDDQIDLATAILLLSQEAYQDLYQITIDVYEYRDRIDEMAMTLKKKIGKTKDPEKIVKTINTYLFQELNFKPVDVEEEPKSYFLSFVLDEKKGSCLGLSMLYLAIAERIGLPLYGVCLPKHYFVRYENGRKRFNIETTNNGISCPDDSYRKDFNVPESNQFYLKSLGKREIFGVFYYNRGFAYYKKGFYDQAIADYEKAIELDPGEAKAYYNKADACEKSGRTKEAVEAYQGFIQYAPPQYASYIEYAKERIQALEGK